jgi:hypothetical protein
MHASNQNKSLHRMRRQLLICFGLTLGSIRRVLVGLFLHMLENSLSSFGISSMSSEARRARLVCAGYFGWKHSLWLFQQALRTGSWALLLSMQTYSTACSLIQHGRITSAELVGSGGASRRIKHTTYVEAFDMLSAIIIEASADNAHLVGYLPALNALTQMVLGTLCSE